MGHINRSRRYISEMYEQGSSILANMATNRDRIKVGPGRAGAGLMRPWAGKDRSVVQQARGWQGIQGMVQQAFRVMAPMPAGC